MPPPDAYGWLLAASKSPLTWRQSLRLNWLQKHGASVQIQRIENVPIANIEWAFEAYFEIRVPLQIGASYLNYGVWCGIRLFDFDPIFPEIYGLPL